MSPEDIYNKGDVVQFTKPRMWNQDSAEQGCIGIVTGFEWSDSGLYIQRVIIDDRWYVLPAEIKSKL